jgi:hypothetical protein
MFPSSETDAEQKEQAKEEKATKKKKKFTLDFTTPSKQKMTQIGKLFEPPANKSSTLLSAAVLSKNKNAVSDFYKSSLLYLGRCPSFTRGIQVRPFKFL